MFKKFFLIVISFYQNVFSYILKNIVGVGNCCRFDVTCSEYAKITIEKEGVIRGGIKSAKRLLSCQPFYSI